MKRTSLCTILLIISFLISGMKPAEFYVNFETTTDRIGKLLSAYSNLLANGSTTYSGGNNSTLTNKLVDERRQFYKEFFEVGLHTSFVYINSNYTPISDVNIQKTDSQTYDVQATELVTIHGKSMISSPEEYPLVQSAYWAIAKTDNEKVKQKLYNYLQNMINGVNKSLHEDIKIDLVLKHTFKIEERGGELIILQDQYNDKSVENSTGTDVVIWEGDHTTRIKPDWNKSPDFIFFHTPVEDLGKILLFDYEEITNRQLQPDSILYYIHSNSVNYANYYTSETTSTCSDGETLQDESHYNSSYAYHECNDCANFVSQAINYGGYSTDGTWYPESLSWVNSVYLENYLVSSGKIYFVSNLSSMSPGDLSWTGDLGHVVMYTGINPARYSGHTNDRLLKNWDSSLTKYGILY